MMKNSAIHTPETAAANRNSTALINAQELPAKFRVLRYEHF